MPLPKSLHEHRKLAGTRKHFNMSESNKPDSVLSRWNTFNGNRDQSVIDSTAELLVSTGLRDAGYQYLIVDDGWQNSSRAADGRQQANTTRFPDGMLALGERLHGLGLKYGIYSTAGSVLHSLVIRRLADWSFPPSILGCGPSSPGSWGYEDLDAQTYADWKVDYLKYDNCGTFQGGTVSPAQRLSLMRDALRNTGRDIFFSLYEWGHQFPWFWAD